MSNIVTDSVVRPSTGTADQKESMQMQFARMEGLWPAEDDLPGFRAKAESTMKQIQQYVHSPCFVDYHADAIQTVR